MCGERLEQPDESERGTERVDSLLATVVFPDLKTQAGMIISGELSLCPYCSAENKAGWNFCQHCGKKLPETAPKPTSAEADMSEPVNPPPAPERSTEISATEAQPDGPELADWQRPMAGVSGAIFDPGFDPNQATVELPSLLQEPPPAPRQSQETAVGASQANPEAYEVGTKCPTCGHMNRQSSVYCSTCGAAMLAATETVAIPALVAPLIRGRLRLVMESGDTDTVYELKDETLIGRQRGDITFAHDGFMSDRHARIVRRGDAFVLTDEGSRNGTYLKIKTQTKLESGDYILLGRQLFQFKV